MIQPGPKRDTTTVRANTREALLAAARTIFARSGYHSTNVSHIVTAVGLAQGSFYNYFGSKREIFEEILTTLVEDLVGRFEAVPIDEVVNRETYYSVGLVLAGSLTNFFLADRDLARIFFWESIGLDEQFDEQIDAAYARITSHATCYAARGQEIGVVRREIPAKVIGAAMVGMCSHVINRILRGDFDDLEIDQVALHLIEIHLQGILVPGGLLA